jgi:hypothetical protein
MLFIVVTQGGHDDDVSRSSVTKKADSPFRPRRAAPSFGVAGALRWVWIISHA